MKTQNNELKVSNFGTQKPKNKKKHSNQKEPNELLHAQFNFSNLVFQKPKIKIFKGF